MFDRHLRLATGQLKKREWLNGIPVKDKEGNGSSGHHMGTRYLLKVRKCVLSPTGFEGICQHGLQLWGIPFHGMVEAA